MNISIICQNPALRDSLRKILCQINGFSVILDSGSLLNFLNISIDTSVDVLILDSITSTKNMEWLGMIKADSCNFNILILTDPDDINIWPMIGNSGVIFTLPRDASKKEFENMIRAMPDHKQFFH
jgi:DNA-binding NarL/FixJ family response regulator